MRGSKRCYRGGWQVRPLSQKKKLPGVRRPLYGGIVDGYDKDKDGGYHYHVVYDDGDEADYTREELMPMLSTHAQSDFRHLAQGHEAAGGVMGEG